MRKLAFGEASVVAFALLALVLLFAAAHTAGCVSAEQGGPQWPPEVAFEGADVEGFVVLETPSGPVRVDIGAGIVTGEGAEGVSVSEVGIDAGGAIKVGGMRQELHVASPGKSTSEGWVQCVAFDSASEVADGLFVRVHAIPPGLDATCGAAAFDVSTFRHLPAQGARQAVTRRRNHPVRPGPARGLSCIRRFAWLT